MQIVLNHPLVNHRITILRDQETPSKVFRVTVEELSKILVYEATRDLRMVNVPVVTPVARSRGDLIADHVVIVPILRAGIGMLPGALEMLPDATVGVLGIQRNEMTAQAEPYCAKVPAPHGDDPLALVIDPMIATGGSACDAIVQLKRLGYRRIRILAIVSAPEGLARLEAEHPDVGVFTAAKDERLNEHFYIIPGVGDAGDRIFGTKPTSTLSRLLKVTERRLLEDGRIDLAESGELLRLARTFTGMSDDFAAFEKILMRVRVDGVIDSAESRRLANILAALADKADAFAVVRCRACGRPISRRRIGVAGPVCPWCGAAHEAQALP